MPCSPTFNALSATQREGRPWTYPWRLGEDPTEYCVRELGLDMVVPVSTHTDGPADALEARTWVETGVLHKAWATPSGELHAAVRLSDAWPHGRDIPLHSDFNVGHYVEPWITCERDLECLKHFHSRPDARRDAVRRPAGDTWPTPKPRSSSDSMARST